MGCQSDKLGSTDKGKKRGYYVYVIDTEKICLREGVHGEKGKKENRRGKEKQITNMKHLIRRNFLRGIFGEEGIRTFWRGWRQGGRRPSHSE